MTGPEPRAAGLDLRLVPAALTSWAVTAIGIVCPPWSSALAVVAAAVATAAVAWWVRRHAPASVPAGWPGVAAVVTVGVAFAISVGLRVHDNSQHPIVTRYGSTASVVVSPTESPRLLGGSRLMFRGSLQALDGAESSGRVVVFATVVGYDELTAGQVALNLGGSVYDPTDPAGRLLFNVLAMVAEFSNRT